MVSSVSATEGEGAVESLKARADRLMMARDVRGASELFQRAIALEPRRVDIWIGLAACRRAAGEARDAMAAVEGALAVDPRFFPRS